MRVFLPCLTIVAACSLPNPSYAQDFSPDGKQAAIPWKGQIQLVPLDAGAPAPVPKSEGGARAKWSPNGRYLVFMTSGPSMSLYDSKAGQTRLLGGNLSFPVAWREDSGRLAMFHTPPTGTPELILYSVGEKGIALRVNVSAAPPATLPMVWLPATDNVAYLAADGNIYTVEEAEIHKITTSNDVIGLSLAPDNKHLLWARRGPNLKYILVSFYSFDLTARSVRRIEFPGNVPGVNPDPRHGPTAIEEAVFSPDGTRLALSVVEEVSAPIKTQPKPAAGKKKPGARPAPPAPVNPPPIRRQKTVYTVRMDGTGASAVASTGPDPASALIPFWSPTGVLGVLTTKAPGSLFTIREPDAMSNHVLLDSGR